VIYPINTLSNLTNQFQIETMYRNKLQIKTNIKNITSLIYFFTVLICSNNKIFLFLESWHSNCSGIRMALAGVALQACKSQINQKKGAL
jgi:hypothetical protein